MRATRWAAAATAVLLTAACAEAVQPVAQPKPSLPSPSPVVAKARTTLDWETARQQTVPGHAPPGWSGEYTPEQVYKDTGEPQVRVARVPEPVRAGGASARFELRRGDPAVNHSTQADLSTQFEPRGAERWYAFSFYLPSDWARDRTPEILAQFHQHYQLDGEPPLAIAISDGEWELQTARDGHSDVTRVGAYRTGAWTDWLVHARWTPDRTGILQIWRDGKPVPGFGNRRGPNTYRSKYGIYLKVGLYKWAWSSGTNRRVMYLDELRIADTRAGVAIPR
ncbi:polysaccharide lyase [Actinoplanes solisilvae]|uniref:polysaccharide lyase n=1 Tax=Actinoplanes solisilvae TaxID=2486853 RepID=UPI000FD7C7C1|nr:polysaccharide lyase [Actinoplanes solisilvae]